MYFENGEKPRIDIINKPDEVKLMEILFLLSSNTLITIKSKQGSSWVRSIPNRNSWTITPVNFIQIILLVIHHYLVRIHSSRHVRMKMIAIIFIYSIRSHELVRRRKYSSWDWTESGKRIFLLKLLLRINNKRRKSILFHDQR